MSLSFFRTRNEPTKKPDSIDVKARRIDFAFDERVPRYWVENDPFETHFMAALSLTFPDGERMFMDAVRNVRDRVRNETTRQDIAGFLGQEALHSRAHEALNELLEKFGYPAAELEKAVRDDIAGHRPDHTDASLLALTCALEHVTAIMGNLMLSRPDIQEKFHETVRPLWMWHAIEETEHKAVAFDVYQEVFGNYAQRVVWLLISTVGLLGTVHMFQAMLLARDGQNKPQVWLKGMWRLWGPRGWLTSLIPDWLSYFRPDFHPWQHDNSALVARYRAQFETPATERTDSGSYSAASGNESASSELPSGPNGAGKHRSKKSAQARM